MKNLSTACFFMAFIFSVGQLRAIELVDASASDLSTSHFAVPAVNDSVSPEFLLVRNDPAYQKRLKHTTKVKRVTWKLDEAAVNDTIACSMEVDSGQKLLSYCANNYCAALSPDSIPLTGSLKLPFGTSGQECLVIVGLENVKVLISYDKNFDSRPTAPVLEATRSADSLNLVNVLNSAYRRGAIRHK